MRPMFNTEYLVVVIESMLKYAQDELLLLPSCMIKPENWTFGITTSSNFNYGY